MKNILVLTLVEKKTCFALKTQDYFTKAYAQSLLKKGLFLALVVLFELMNAWQPSVKYVTMSLKWATKN